jgi:hypothetical protein
VTHVKKEIPGRIQHGIQAATLFIADVSLGKPIRELHTGTIFIALLILNTSTVPLFLTTNQRLQLFDNPKIGVHVVNDMQGNTSPRFSLRTVMQVRVYKNFSLTCDESSSIEIIMLLPLAGFGTLVLVK